jgi:hypothetical protein
LQASFCSYGIPTVAVVFVVTAVAGIPTVAVIPAVADVHVDVSIYIIVRYPFCSFRPGDAEILSLFASLLDCITDAGIRNDTGATAVADVLEVAGFPTTASALLLLGLPLLLAWHLCSPVTGIVVFFCAALLTSLLFPASLLLLAPVNAGCWCRFCSPTCRCWPYYRCCWLPLQLVASLLLLGLLLLLPFLLLLAFLLLLGCLPLASLQLLMSLDARCYLTIGKFKFRNFVADLLKTNFLAFVRKETFFRRKTTELKQLKQTSIKFQT